MANINCLENIRCPECLHEDGFYIDTSVSAFVTDDGAEPANGNFRWDAANAITCPECDHDGTVGEFTRTLPAVTIDQTPPAGEAPALRTYTVLFAEDIPHYAHAEIEAMDAAHALLVARAFDASALCYEPSWGDADAVCKRIVCIEDSSGADIARDIPLDNYFLRNGGDADRLLCEAAPGLLEVVRYADQVLSSFRPDALRNLGLDVLFEKSRSALATVTPN